MITIHETIENEYTSYRFVANNTSYEVLTTDDVKFVVHSQRQGQSIVTPPKVYYTLGDMAKRSKAFNELATYISS